MGKLIEELCFSTPIWRKDIANAQRLNEKLAKRIDALHREGKRGWAKERTGGWQSDLDLHRDDRFADFTKILQRLIGKIGGFYRIDPQFELCIESCWANVVVGDDANAYHTHAGADFAGVYYVRAPEGSGKVRFRDPRLQPGLFAPPIDRFTTYTAQAIEFAPKEGRLLLFPGWLEHEVRPNTIKGGKRAKSRISISFNLECFKKSWIAKLGLGA